MTVQHYDPKSITIIFGPVLMSGFAPDTFLMVEKNVDIFSLQVGADGEACRTRSRNNSARMTVTLMQSSPVNDLLSALHEVDRAAPSGSGCLPFLVKDLVGRSLFAAELSWIVKPAPAEFGVEAGTREWVIETADLQTFVAGS